MKRWIALLLALLLFALFSGGCALPEQSGKRTIVTTLFAEYDWARQILGDTAEWELILLTDNGTELHSFQPTAADIIQIAQADLFIYTASEQTPWIEEALKTEGNPARIALDLNAVLADKALREEHDHEGHEEHDASIDPHHWLSPKNALLLSEAIAQKIMEADPANQEAYQRNYADYRARLEALDQAYSQAFGEGATLIFADRYPFRYLEADYPLTCYAAFPGCTAETNADFKTVMALAQQVQKIRPAALLTVDGGDPSLAQTILSTAKVEAEILSVASMQSVTKARIEEGLDYLTVMEENLNIFKKATGEKQ